MAAVDAGDKTDLALAFQRTARSVRQTIALKAKLERDRVLLARELRDQAEQDQAARIVRRKAQIRLEVERTIWDEAEDEDLAELLVVELDDWLDAAALEDDFAEGGVARHIARLRRELHLEQGPLPMGEGDPEGAPGVRPARAEHPHPLHGRATDDTDEPGPALRQSSA